MSNPPLVAFLDGTRVTVDLDPSSSRSLISLSLAHTLNLPCIFTATGHQTCSATLVVPTINGFYRSRLEFTAGYDLPAGVVLGSDWVVPCQPIPLEGQSSLQQPMPHFLDRLPPPHRWYPVAAPIDLSQKLWGPEMGARDALSSIVTECYINDMFCSDLLYDHAIAPISDSDGERRAAVLAHLLNGKCVSKPSIPSFDFIADFFPLLWVYRVASYHSLSWTMCSER